VISLATSESTLLVPRYDDDYILWCGKPASHESLKSQYNFTQVRYADELKSVLEAAASGSGVVHVLDGEDVGPLKELGFKVDDGKLRTAVTEARVIKTAHEIELMRKV
jgi:Xaa-Pro aminopeptidase